MRERASISLHEPQARSGNIYHGIYSVLYTHTYIYIHVRAGKARVLEIKIVVQLSVNIAEASAPTLIRASDVLKLIGRDDDGSLLIRSVLCLDWIMVVYGLFIFDIYTLWFFCDR